MESRLTTPDVATLLTDLLWTRGRAADAGRETDMATAGGEVVARGVVGAAGAVASAVVAGVACPTLAIFETFPSSKPKKKMSQN